MSIIRDLTEHPDSKRLFKNLSVASALWSLGIIFFCISVFAVNGYQENLADADSIIRAAAKVRSSPGQIMGNREPLSEISEIIDKLGIKQNVTQLGASSSGLVLAVAGIDTDTFASLAEEISHKGLLVKSAELRALSSGGQRKLSVSVSIGGKDDAN
ncbi:MAG: hypothetical protein PHG70_07575 [Synergistaceae bacterium]|nr:hypothetical protein [Synergistaceae bacterium]